MQMSCKKWICKNFLGIYLIAKIQELPKMSNSSELFEYSTNTQWNAIQFLQCWCRWIISWFHEEKGLANKMNDILFFFGKRFNNEYMLA